MSDNFRIKLKPKVKLKIAIFILLTGSLLAALFWTLLNSNFFHKQDSFVHSNFVALEAESCRYYGKYPKYKCKFKIAGQGYFISELTSKPNKDGKYCVGQVFKNDDFVEHVLAHHDNCV